MATRTSLTGDQEQPLPHLGHGYRTVPLLQVPSFRAACQELQEVRGRYILRPAQPQVRYRCLAGRAEKSVPGLLVQEQLHPNAEEAEGVLLVQRAPRPALPRCIGARSQAREDGAGGYDDGGQRAGVVF